ncbi:hypothetical protein AB0I28_12295 [Phytomonospora sp. NPDC050363]|uniref:hypothetical protein n=1 Tax=Phytomonospora sp. NPDC050363 TaxID=3155642 RepID=UPI0033E464C6
MTPDAWVIAASGIGGAALLLACIGRKRILTYLSDLGRAGYAGMVLSPAHIPSLDCGCDSCHYATLPAGVTTPADRYLIDEARALTARAGELELSATELEAANQRIRDAIAEPCPVDCLCLECIWTAVEDAHGPFHPDIGWEMDYDDADQFDEIVCAYFDSETQ